MSNAPTPQTLNFWLSDTYLEYCILKATDILFCILYFTSLENFNYLYLPLDTEYLPVYMTVNIKNNINDTIPAEIFKSHPPPP